MKSRVDYSLYLVTDQSNLNDRSLLKVLEDAIVGGVTLVQLREKALNSRQFYHLAQEVRELTAKYDIPLIINDRLDIAMVVEADGVHVGQKDLPAKEVRKLLGHNKILGVSVATLDEALKAQEDGADYLGVGALFPTSTKNDTREVSLKKLTEIKKTVDIPVVGIGGIKEDNVSSVLSTGVDGVAVVSAIMGAMNSKEAAIRMRQYLNK